jgi:hypothetical protein
MMTVRATSATKAFERAVEDAKYEYGHGGYTGSIAEKSRFKMIVPPSGVGALAHAEELLGDDDHWVGDKWGPAGCIKLNEEDPGPEWSYLFFGWASS